MPTGGNPNASRNLWYSTNIGNVHVTVYSTEHDFLLGSDQYNWIQQVRTWGSSREDTHTALVTCF
jgi:hypothetical protein